MSQDLHYIGTARSKAQHECGRRSYNNALAYVERPTRRKRGGLAPSRSLPCLRSQGKAGFVIYQIAFAPQRSYSSSSLSERKISIMSSSCVIYEVIRSAEESRRFRMCIGLGYLRPFKLVGGMQHLYEMLTSLHYHEVRQTIIHLHRFCCIHRSP